LKGDRSKKVEDVIEDSETIFLSLP